MGDSVPWAEVKEMQIKANGLLAGDVVRVVTGKSAEVVFKAPADGELELTYRMDAPGFAAGRDPARLSARACPCCRR